MGVFLSVSHGMSARRPRALLTASVLVAALGGAAAQAAEAAPAAPAAITASEPAGRYAGKAVALGEDLVAVLRDDPRAGGPEVWVRAVPPHWQPGDAYMYRVLDTLDRDHLTTTQRGLSLRLTGADGPAPVLLATGGRAGPRTFPLPKAGTPDARGCTVVTEHAIGAGTVAVLSNGPQGPSAFFRNAADGTRVGGVVDRAHPALPRSAGFAARLVRPDGPDPGLVTDMEGGGHPSDTIPFPAPGCVG